MKTPKRTAWILGDQLSLRTSSLAGQPVGSCRVLLIESFERSRQLPYHKQKLVLVWSAMRHFAEELRALGYEVDYRELQPDFQAALQSHLRRHRPSRLRLMESAEHGVTDRLAGAARSLGIDVEVTPQSLFISDRSEFAAGDAVKKTFLLERFYRKMRRKTGLLLEGDQPAGSAWNFDKANRERPEPGHRFPEIPRFPPDPTTRRILEVVAREFPGHFGNLEEFSWPVTRREADEFLEDFLENRLDLFGPYEDAVIVGQRALYHSLLSPLFNIGLLEPLEACRRAEARWRSGKARLNSVEGFIRQVIGWREFVYQVYRFAMPGYRTMNRFGADLPLPGFYWTAETDMFCVADAIGSLRRWGINHHIQRLMVTGNFALLAGIDPQAVNDWYWLAYVDAFDWVVTPNVLGMALYADGGLFATKPYAASANYISRMSDCCVRCSYRHRESLGNRACPFNSLYWDFLARNRDSLKSNSRMGIVLGALRRKSPSELEALRRQARWIRDRLRAGEKV